MKVFRRAVLWRFIGLALGGASCSPSALSQDNTVFRVETRLVEVFATVRDHNGRYIDGLPVQRFEVRDNGEVQRITTFESNTSQFACAILLDTTGSMAAALPAVKNSVLKIIDDLRETDSVAVYGFSAGVVRLQDFTTDKAAAKQAVLRTRPGGATALFDAVSQVAREIAPRAGKKAIVVFTDGDDNASLLNARAAVQRAKKTGVPIFTIAEGDALKRKPLLNQLADIADTTGGASYEAWKTNDATLIFRKIFEGLRHTYLLAYRPPASSGQSWRTIQVVISGEKDARIRAKEGYIPE